MSWRKEHNRHSFAAKGVKTRKVIKPPKYQPLNHITQVMMLKDRPIYNGNNASTNAFKTDPNLMVKVSGIMEYLFSDTSLTDEQREQEARAYQFAYDYIRGATKHYTKEERDTYFANPRMIYYLNMAYLENITPDAYDRRKRDHYMRNYKRGLKELEHRMRQLAKEDERIKEQQLETMKVIEQYRNNMNTHNIEAHGMVGGVFSKVWNTIKSVFSPTPSPQVSPFRKTQHVNDPLNAQIQPPQQPQSTSMNTALPDMNLQTNNVVVENTANVPIAVTTTNKRGGNNAA